MSSECAITLNHLKLIHISGTDTQQFLQGQLTIDVAELAKHPSWGALCDAKGKASMVYLAFSVGDDIYLLTHTTVLENAIAALQKYAVFSQVSIKQCEAATICGLAGAELDNWLNQHQLTLPDEPLSHSDMEATLVIRMPHPHIARALVIDLAGHCELVEHAINAPLTWEVMDIQAGLPMLVDVTINEYVPQMFNLQALEGISFTKGCYIGQETIARTKYLGKNKRAAFILRSDTPLELSPGDILEQQVGENWRRMGQVLRGATTEQSWALAVLPNDTDEHAIIRLKSAPESRFSLVPLPYQLG